MKTQSNIQSLLAATLVAALTFTSASADSAASPATSPEVHLLSSVIALSGQSLAKPEAQRQLKDALVRYDETAPREGRDERTEEALVSLGVSTPEQARQFSRDVQAMNELHSPTLIQAEMAKIISRAKGAQFSICDAAGVTLGASFVVGISTVLSSHQEICGIATAVGFVAAMIGFGAASEGDCPGWIVL
jgi:hypothetical protein